MTLLAVSDSPLSRRLLAAGTLDVDALEVHGPHVAAARTGLPGQRLLLHNPLHDWSLAARDATAPERVAAIVALAEAAGAPWVSIHLGFAAERIAMEPGGMRARSELLSYDVVFERACAALGTLRAALPVPLLVENLDLEPTGAYDHVCEPGFIAAAVDATGVGILLDVAHAAVSAAALGLALDAYLGELPLDAVAQLHVSAPRRDGARVLDAHEPLDSDGLAAVGALLERTAARAVTLEYGGRDAGTLRAQVASLRELTG